jgi:L-amino acid N-acyltransferase YncA
MASSKIFFNSELPIMIIRKAKLLDAPAIAKAHIDAWRNNYKGIVADDFLSNMDYRKRTERWNKILSQNASSTFVAIENDEILGFASAGKNRDDNIYKGELYSMYMTMRHQKRGIGLKLIQTAVDYLLENKMNSMSVWVLKDNPANNF